MQQLYTIARAGDLKDTVGVWTTYSDERFKKHSMCHVQPSTLFLNELDISLNEMP